MRTYSLTQFLVPLLHLKCTSRYFGRTVLPHQVVIICTDCGLWKLHVTLHLKHTHGISVLLSLKQFLLKNAVSYLFCSKQSAMLSGSRSLVRCQSVTMNWHYVMWPYGDLPEFHENFQSWGHNKNWLHLHKQVIDFKSYCCMVHKYYSVFRSKSYFIFSKEIKNYVSMSVCLPCQYLKQLIGSWWNLVWMLHQ
jgi:hypothetical protein